MGKLIIDGNRVYEMDEVCLRQKEEERKKQEQEQKKSKKS